MPEAVRSRLDPITFEPALKRVVVDEAVRDHSGTDAILRRARSLGLEVEETWPESDSLNQRYRTEKSTLLLRQNRGSFIKPWESPPSIVGRDEWCLTPVEGCPFDCSYCYLQDYLDRPLVQAFVNQEEIVPQIRAFLEEPPSEPPFFFSLGELSDGLFLDPITETIARVWPEFASGEAKLEVRSKSHHVHHLPGEIKPHSNAVFSWSLSPSGRDQRNEMLTSPLDQRLAAMRTLLSEGFRVAARLDPVLLQGEWEREYQQLVDRMTDWFELDELTFLLVGTFRFPRGFDRTMQERFPNRTFLQDEFVEGPDGKMRYPRSRRTRAYRRLRSLLIDAGGDPKLCMEPSYVWEDAGYD